MNCFCDDCKVAARTYENWVVHLTTPQHQDLSASPRIESWVTEQNQACIIIASLFEKMSPAEVANKFSKYGFLFNFYSHHDQKFFILQYDTRQTADFALAKVSHETSWRLHIKRLKDLDTVDWAALFPPDPESEPDTREDEPESGPPSKVARIDSQCDGSTAKSSDSGFVSDKPGMEALQPQRNPPQPMVLEEEQTQKQTESTNKGSEYCDPFELVDLPAINPPKPPSKKKQSNPNLIPITPTKPKPATVTRSPNVTSFVQDLLATETETIQNHTTMTYYSTTKKQELRKQLNGNSPHSAAKSVQSALDAAAPAGNPLLQHGDLEPLPTKQSMAHLMTLKKDSCVDEQLDQFFKSTAISLKELEKINITVVQVFVQVLRKKYPQAELCLFDSFQGGIGNPNCSFEISIEGLDSNKQTSRRQSGKEEEKRCESYVKEIAKLLDLERNALADGQCPFRGIRMKLLGQASRVHFIHKISNRHEFILTPCYGRAQISRKNNIKLITFYAKLDPSVRSLLCFVFYWATFHKFISLEYQEIRDYVLSLLVIVFLSRKKVIPTLDKLQAYCHELLNVSEEDWLEKLCNNETLSQAAVTVVQKRFVPVQTFILDLAKQFFTMFAGEELRTQAICTWTSSLLPKSVFANNLNELPQELAQYRKFAEKRKSSDIFDPNTALAIQNPFDLTYNSGNSVKTVVFRRFQSACAHTAKLIEELMANESEGKSCSLMNVFSELPQASFSEDDLPINSTSTSESGRVTSTHSARVDCESIIRRIRDKMKALKIREGPCINDQHKRYCCFFIDRNFRDKFKKHTAQLEYYKKDEMHLRNAQLCCLWSSFAIDFFQSIWGKCYFIDSTERIWHQEQELLGAMQKGFPTLHVTYYSTFECKGYAPMPARERDSVSSQPLPIGSNPLNEEWKRTEPTLAEARSRKQAGKPVWTFNCTVAYEDPASRHENPKLAAVITGNHADTKNFEYLTHSVNSMFSKYQQHMLEVWLNKMRK